MWRQQFPVSQPCKDTAHVQAPMTKQFGADMVTPLVNTLHPRDSMTINENKARRAMSQSWLYGWGNTYVDHSTANNYLGMLRIQLFGHTRIIVASIKHVSNFLQDCLCLTKLAICRRHCNLLRSLFSSVMCSRTRGVNGPQASDWPANRIDTMNQLNI